MYTQKTIYTHGTPIVHTTNQLYTWRSMCAHIEVIIISILRCFEYTAISAYSPKYLR